MAGAAEVVAASAPLTRAAYQKCSRELRPGEVKRVMQRGPLVGYFLACPACGFSASYLDDEVGYVEEPPKERPLQPGQHRDLVRVERPPACYKCRRLLRVAEPAEPGDPRRLEAVDQ